MQGDDQLCRGFPEPIIILVVHHIRTKLNQAGHCIHYSMNSNNAPKFAFTDKTEDRTELNKTEIENLKSSTENGKINKSLELDSDDEANKSSEEEKEENDADDNQQSDKSEGI